MGVLYMWGKVHGFLDEGSELEQVIGKTIRPRSPKEAYPPTILENWGVGRAWEGLLE